MGYNVEVYNRKTEDSLTNVNYGSQEEAEAYLWHLLNNEKKQNYNKFEIRSAFNRIGTEKYQFCIGDNYCVRVTMTVK